MVLLGPSHSTCGLLVPGEGSRRAPFPAPGSGHLAACSYPARGLSCRCRHLRKSQQFYRGIMKGLPPLGSTCQGRSLHHQFTEEESAETPLCLHLQGLILPCWRESCLLRSGLF